MNVHDLYEAICQLDDALLQKSEHYSKPRKSFDARWLAPVALIAAMLTLILWTPLTRDYAPGAEAPEAEAPAAPEAEAPAAPEAEAPGAPLAPPEMEDEEEWYYNDGEFGVWTYEDPIGYARYDLQDDQLAQLLPAELIADCTVTGLAGYDGQGNLMEVQIHFVYEQEEGPMEITLSVYRPWFAAEYAGRGEPEAYNHKGTDFVLFHGKVNDWILLSAEATLNGAECAFSMESSDYSMAEMKAVFESVLDCFAGSEYPDLSVLESWQPENEE